VQQASEPERVRLANAPSVGAPRVEPSEGEPSHARAGQSPPVDAEQRERVAAAGAARSVTDPSVTEPSVPESDATAPAKRRIYSVGQTTWIRPRAEVKEGAFLGYLRTGSSMAVISDERVPGVGCPKGFWRVEPRGYVCHDRTVSEAPPESFRLAADATRGKAGPFPYGYAISNGTPMYNRVPNSSEQARYERWLGAPGSRVQLPLTLRSHEELASERRIEATHPIPSFLVNGGSARAWPFDLVEQTIPLGSMLAYTEVFEAEGRRWLLSADHTLVPADRVRPFEPSAFRGTDLGRGVSLPIAWARSRERPLHERTTDGFTPSDEKLAVRSFVELTGQRVTEGGRVLLETKRDSSRGPLYLDERDATVVEAEAKLPTGVRPGQKWMLIRLTQGTLVAYEDLEPVYATLVSPGAGGVPRKGGDLVKDSTTPTGTYSITFKDRAATMSPEKGKNRSFWIADVPHTQYFHPPFALHAAYWHERFGDYVSAGCINASPLDAEHLFHWSDPPVPDGWQGATGAGAKENGPTSAIVVRR
jgi:lipoprotein-anchoring transpeptidase ErfK/SrfK